MARKRKTLPKNFEEMLETASLDELKAVFDKCLIDARGGYGKQTALGFLDCPDELVTWLVGQGLDVDAGDNYNRSPFWERAYMGRTAQIPLLLELGADIEKPDLYGATPLHAAAGNQRPASTRMLLEHGADLGALNDEEMTPLEWGLLRTGNNDIADMAETAAVLIEAGAVVTDNAQELVRRIGEQFEFHRDHYNPEYLDEVDAGLAHLYELFGVQPVAARQMHDGTSPIEMPVGDWSDQHDALWELLVPSMGAAATLQGEVIRVTGRIAFEIHENGGANWDRHFKAMLKELPVYLQQGTPLPEAELAELAALTGEIASGDADDDELRRLMELAVRWVAANREPIQLDEVPYDR